MPISRLQIPHQLGVAEAKQRISKFAEVTRQRPNPLISDIVDTWSESSGTFRFRVFGMTISGKVNVEPTQVAVEIEYPLAATPFKARIEQDIMAKASEVLAMA